MGRSAEIDADPAGWDWFEAGSKQDVANEDDDLARAFARSFNGSDGAIVVRHLRQTILDRRLGPSASDAELRFLEGQRSVAAHILSMIDRGRG
ncbi:MAG: hypothetical protein OEU92_09155 [Alphaproteobacteria bacterium]|nr:hypothetical protein [Alphaproteobacteria bacterium]